MAWPVIAAMAVMGALQANSKNNATRRKNEVDAVKTRTSPDGGWGPGGYDSSEESVAGGAIKGGLAGYSAGQDKSADKGSMGLTGGKEAKQTGFEEEEFRTPKKTKINHMDNYA